MAIDFGVETGVYLITNTVTGEKYVGSTSRSFRNRWSVHRARWPRGKGNRNLRDAWTKHGEDALVFSVLERIACHDMIIEREQYWIDTLRPEYNVVPRACSSRGYRHTDECKQRMSAAKKGRKLTDEHKAKVGAACLGHRTVPITDERRRQLSEAAKQKPIQPVGYKHSAATRAKLRMAHLGRKLPDCVREKQSAAHRELWRRKKEAEMST